MSNKKTLVIGASENPIRISNVAVKKLRKYKHDVVAIGQKKGKIDDVLIQTTTDFYPDIHTITLYINPERQKNIYDYILSIKPQRVIFNPGTENPELEQLLDQNNITHEKACTLVLLTVNQF